MSRVGKKPIPVPEKVTIDIKDNVITVKGPKGELSQAFNPELTVKFDNNTVIVERPNDEKKFRALHGLTRALISNMVDGVTEGYEKALRIVGVGYLAEMKGTRLLLSLGYSHQILVDAPDGIAFKVERDVIKISGIDKQKVGEVAAQVRKFRKPEPYKGKGVRYVDEHIQRKAGKTAGSA